MSDVATTATTTSDELGFWARVRDLFSFHGMPLAPILVLFGLNAADELDTMSFDVLGPEITEHFGVGIETFGVIIILILVLAPLVSVPIAYLGDRTKRMPLAVAAAVTWGTFSVITGLAPFLWLLIVARVGSGFGRFVNEPLHAGLIGDFYTRQARTRAFGIHQLANPVGQFFGASIAGLLAAAFDWRVPFLVFAIPTAIIVLFALRIPEPARGQHEIVHDTPPWRQAVGQVWGIRTLRNLFVGSALAVGSLVGLGIILPFFFDEEFDVGPGPRGPLIGFGMALMGLAMVFGSAIVQRRIVQRPSLGLRLIARLGVAAAILLAIGSGAPNLPIFIIVAYGLAIMFGLIVPGALSIISIAAPPEMRSTAFAVLGVITLLGYVFAALNLFIAAYSVRLAMTAMAPVTLFGITFIFRATRFVDHDVAVLDADRTPPGARGEDAG